MNGINGYELSRAWFNWCFENPEKISPKEIQSCNGRKSRSYIEGGFYMIKNTVNGKIYVGKSMNYLARLKEHQYPSSNKSLIDIDINNKDMKFEYFLLAKYKDLGINFFNRELETIIEHRFITIAGSTNPHGYNRRHYGHL